MLPLNITPQPTTPIPDQKEREKALDPSHSYIVQAPAGSGKTELLTRRLLLLLSLVEKPEDILAITFTKKAAAEMRARIIDSILEYMAETPKSSQSADISKQRLIQKVIERDKIKQWGLLENPGRLKIMTIDSLCASLTRQMPLLTDMTGHTLIDDSPELLYLDAARRTILLVEKPGEIGKAVRSALRHLDNSILALEKRVTVMLAKRDQWSRHIHKDMESAQLKNELEHSLRQIVLERLTIAKSSYPESLIPSLISSVQWASINLKNDNGRILKTINTLPDTATDDLTEWKAISNLLLTIDGSWRKPNGVNKRCGFPSDKSPEAVQYKREFQNILQELSGNDTLLEVLKEIRILPHPAYGSEQWQLVEALAHLLPTAVEMLEQIFKEQGRSDFIGVSQAALTALGNEDQPTDLMLSMDLKIQHILVDEYQDTSRTHHSLLKALTVGWEEGDGRTIFLVGDPMQSIYLFREAEVGIFLETVKNGIGEIKPDFLTLKSNFRSQKKIVEWFNDCFTSSFPQAEDSFLGRVPYSGCQPLKPSQDTGVNITLFENGDELSESKKILEILDENRRWKEKTAILVSSRSHLKHILPALKKSGITYRSQKINPLKDSLIIKDLFSILKAFRSPYDRTVWLSLLRSPLCGLSMTDILHICSTATDHPLHTVPSSIEKETIAVESIDSRHLNQTLYELITETLKNNSLPQKSQKRLKRFMESINKGMKLRGKVSIRAIIEGIWISLGGPVCANGTDLEDAELFFNLLETLTEGGDLIRVDKFKSRIKTLYANPESAEDAHVEIMTVHEAKGLEFDNVIIPGIGKRSRSMERDLVLLMEKEQELFLAPVTPSHLEKTDSIYSFLTFLRSQKFRFEKGRLLYVAATRAIKNLTLLGHVNVDKKNSKLTPETDSLLSTIWPNIEEKATDFLIKKNAQPPDKTKSTTLTRVVSDWKMPSPPLSIHINIKSGKSPSAKDGFVFEWAGDNAKHLGVVLHRYFKRVASDGLDSWSVARVKNEIPFIKAILKEAGVSHNDMNPILNKGIGIMINSLVDERGRWILSDHKEASSELAVTGFINEKIIHGVIDRTFVDNEGTRWIIDYKTGGHEGGALSDFLAQEKSRYQEQIEQYATIMQLSGEKRLIKKGLYFPAVSKWIEW